MFDYSKLKGRIREICKSDFVFAEKMNINRSTMSLKLNNKSEFTQEEIKRACDVLEIPNEEIGKYFFASKVVN